MSEPKIVVPAFMHDGPLDGAMYEVPMGISDGYAAPLESIVVRDLTYRLDSERTSNSAFPHYRYAP